MTHSLKQPCLTYFLFIPVTLNKINVNLSKFISHIPDVCFYVLKY